MLGGADNPNGELPSYITGADMLFSMQSGPQRNYVGSVSIAGR